MRNVNPYVLRFNISAGGNGFTVAYHRLTRTQVTEVANILSRAFRDITVANADTGEVAFNTYYDEGWFVATLTDLEAIRLVKTYLDA